MKSLLVRAFLALGVLGLVAVGCQPQHDEDVLDDEDLAEEELVDGEPAVDEQDWTQQQICQDLVVHLLQKKFCGFQEGPFDVSPVFVNCTRTCVTDRYIVLQPSYPGAGWTCETGETTCTPWVCPPCD